MDALFGWPFRIRRRPFVERTWLTCSVGGRLRFVNVRLWRGFDWCSPWVVVWDLLPSVCGADLVDLLRWRSFKVRRRLFVERV